MNRDPSTLHRGRWKEKLAEDRVRSGDDHTRGLTLVWGLMGGITLLPLQDWAPQVNWVGVPILVIGYFVALLWSRFRAPAAWIFSAVFWLVSCVLLSLVVGATEYLPTRIGLCLFAGAVIAVLVWVNRRKWKRRDHRRGRRRSGAGRT